MGDFLVGEGPWHCGLQRSPRDLVCGPAPPLSPRPMSTPGEAEPAVERDSPPSLGGHLGPLQQAADARPLPPRVPGQPQRLRCKVQVGRKASSEPRRASGGPWRWPQSPPPAFRRQRVLWRKFSCNLLK